MTNSAGNLSIDFLVGFTIFTVAFIWMATLVPTLFLGVSAYGIDFDAVAYRTGVILAEDPGATDASATGPWELQLDSGKGLIERFGLAVSKETPNILSETKVNRFFNKTVFSYPDDYRSKAIFGDYPYRFNISLQEVGESKPLYVGDTLPDSDYGFIRREVKIKHSSNATINTPDFIKYKLYNTGIDGNVTFHDFSIAINTIELSTANITDPVTNPNYDAAYRIDPQSDWINITVDDLDNVTNQTLPQQPNWIVNGGGYTPEINVSKVRFYESRYGVGGLSELLGTRYKNFMYVDGVPTWVDPPVNLKNNVTLVFKPGFFPVKSTTGVFYVNLTFGVKEKVNNPNPPPDYWYQGMQFLNTSGVQPFDYNYNVTDVTQPKLTDAVMEVAVW